MLNPERLQLLYQYQLLLGRLDNLFAYYICDTLKLRLEGGIDTPFVSFWKLAICLMECLTATPDISSFYCRVPRSRPCDLLLNVRFHSVNIPLFLVQLYYHRAYVICS